MRTHEASIHAPPCYPDLVKKKAPPLNFPRHLVALRKQRGLTQLALAEMVQMHISQIRRYQSGQSQPTLDAIRKPAMALSVSADRLLFEQDERGPDEEWRIQFEAVARLDPEEKKIIHSVIENIILRHKARRWSGADSGGSR
jgi:transcriptional regulator with XRE-family HTH domain